MSSQPPSDAPSGQRAARSAGFHGTGYVSRYKLQQQRIRTLNQLESSSEAKKKNHKSLPKINDGPDKENLVIRAVRRSNTMDVIKLPGVKATNPAVPTAPPPPAAQKRKTLPVRTYHLRVNPDHASFISKSLPSLPSIPGSPSYTEDQAVSPLTDRPPQADKVRLPVFPSKHRFEKIAFQKRIHKDPTDEVKLAQTQAADPHHNPQSRGPRLPPAAVRGLPVERSHQLPPQPHGPRALEKPHTSGSIRIRYSKVPSEVGISETQSEPSFEVSARKWKDDCRCLRCQMLRRQFQERDSHYSLWGRYPCHHVDPSVMLDD